VSVPDDRRYTDQHSGPSVGGNIRIGITDYAQDASAMSCSSISPPSARRSPPERPGRGRIDQVRRRGVRPCGGVVTRSTRPGDAPSGSMPTPTERLVRRADPGRHVGRPLLDGAPIAPHRLTLDLTSKVTVVGVTPRYHAVRGAPAASASDERIRPKPSSPPSGSAAWGRRLFALIVASGPAWTPGRSERIRRAATRGGIFWTMSPSPPPRRVRWRTALVRTSLHQRHLCQRGTMR
jgi:hypothetical protein